MLIDVLRTGQKQGFEEGFELHIAHLGNADMLPLIKAAKADGECCCMATTTAFVAWAGQQSVQRARAAACCCMQKAPRLLALSRPRSGHTFGVQDRYNCDRLKQSLLVCCPLAAHEGASPDVLAFSDRLLGFAGLLQACPCRGGIWPLPRTVQCPASFQPLCRLAARLLTSARSALPPMMIAGVASRSDLVLWPLQASPCLSRQHPT